jgi:cytoskeletal protein RodZ
MATTLQPPKPVASLPDLAGIRQRKGISLDQISEDTKIAVRYLEAIERSDFDTLPGGIFSTSYIRQYARAIDYDESDLLACYDSAIRPPEPEERPKQGFLSGTLGRLFIPRRA